MGASFDAERVRFDPVLRRGNRPLNSPRYPPRCLPRPPLENQVQGRRPYPNGPECVGLESQAGGFRRHTTSIDRET